MTLREPVEYLSPSRVLSVALCRPDSVEVEGFWSISFEGPRILHGYYLHLRLFATVINNF